MPDPGSSQSDPTGSRLRQSAQPLHYAHSHSLPWYFTLSKQPLQILLFLTPLIALYAIGTWYYGTDPQTGAVITISAYERLVDFYAIFGVTGLYLPGITLIIVFLVWHFLKHDSWQLHPGVPLVMWVESWILALPLLVTDQVLTRLGSSNALIRITALAPAFTGLALTGTLADYPWQTRLVLGIGAGLYEELLFRMVGIALFHFILVDIFRLKNTLGITLAIILSALAFTIYHDLSPGSTDTLNLQLAFFYFICGLYFGALFVVRGFGVAVGTHAAYDILVIVILPLLRH